MLRKIGPVLRRKFAKISGSSPKKKKKINNDDADDDDGTKSPFRISLERNSSICNNAEKKGIIIMIIHSNNGTKCPFRIR
jgi:hypothetical protein